MVFNKAEYMKEYMKEYAPTYYKNNKEKLNNYRRDLKRREYEFKKLLNIDINIFK